MKFCTDCKYFACMPASIKHRCMHHNAENYRNSVDGVWPDCLSMRERADCCGDLGEWYYPKERVLTALTNSKKRKDSFLSRLFSCGYDY